MNNRKVFLRLFLCLSFGWGALTFGYAQTVSKTFSDAPLKTVLKEVESQTGLSVVYKTDEVDVNRKVNASFQNASLEDVMAQILDKGLTWTIQEKMIVISKLPQEQVQSAKKGLNVRGVILDETGIPVIGASVLVRGSSNGTITDIDGNFSIADVPQDAMIDISYIGYKTLTFKATDKALANVVLKEDTEVLEEVVVVGYGTAKKANLSGSGDRAPYQRQYGVCLARTYPQLQCVVQRRCDQQESLVQCAWRRFYQRRRTAGAD